MKRVVTLLFTTLLLAVIALAQSPQPTNAPQFTVNLSFLGVAPYGQTTALDVGANFQLTTNDRLRWDLVTIPNVGYTGNLFGTSYDFCAFKALESLLAPTALNCGNFSPYGTASAGYARIQQNSGPATQAAAWKVQVGANYTPTNRVAFNLFEIGYCDFGVKVPGQSHSGLCGQSGLNFLFGTNAAATQAKSARISRANKKKLDRLNARIAAAQKG